MKKILLAIIVAVIGIIVVVFATDASFRHDLTEIFPGIFNTAGLVLVAVIAMIVVFLSKGSYNVFGSGQVHHNVRVQHNYYGDPIEDDEPSMNEETKKWFNNS